jgi:hypothetical protein
LIEVAARERLATSQLPVALCKTQSNNGPQKRLRIAVVAE